MRKEKIVTLQDGGTERKFKIRQMSAMQQERWINRAIMLLTKDKECNEKLSGFLKGQLNEDLLSVVTFFIGRLSYDDAEPLYDELLECCAYLPTGSQSFTDVLTRETADTIISDVKTLYTLRWEALSLNFSFFTTGSPSQEVAGGQEAIRISKNTRTSHQKRESLSPNA